MHFIEKHIIITIYLLNGNNEENNEF